MAWTQSTNGTWYPSRSPKEFQGIWISSADGSGITNGQRIYQRGQWSAQNFSDVLPANCKAAWFKGFFIISHGQAVEDANLLLGWRSYQEPFDYWYNGQVIEPLIGSGVRNDYSSGWVAMNNGWCEVWWDCLDGLTQQQIPYASYPARSSYAINLSVVAALT